MPTIRFRPAAGPTISQRCITLYFWVPDSWSLRYWRRYKIVFVFDRAHLKGG